MGRHSYGYDPDRDTTITGWTPPVSPSEPPPLIPQEAGDGTGAEESNWQSAGESVL